VIVLPRQGTNALHDALHVVISETHDLSPMQSWQSFNLFCLSSLLSAFDSHLLAHVSTSYVLLKQSA
jgi:hypothetical protein